MKKGIRRSWLAVYSVDSRTRISIMSCSASNRHLALIQFRESIVSKFGESLPDCPLNPSLLLLAQISPGTEEAAVLHMGRTFSHPLL